MQDYEITLENESDFFLVARALASKERMRILKLLLEKDCPVNEIADALQLPPSTTAQHVKILENARLIQTEYQPGIRGSMKMCTLHRNAVRLVLRQSAPESQRTVRIEMPIGGYTSCQVTDHCGLSGAHGHIGDKGGKGVFYLPERLEAQMIWISRGYLEYRFPNIVLEGQAPKAMRFSCELCSEAWGYDETWKSDITLWVNEQDCGFFASPGDFGKRRGLLNPEWYQNDGTQYGLLKCWEVNELGTFIDGKLVSPITIGQLHLETGDHITIRLGVKSGAEHEGGFNLFGSKFGDYPQDLVMEMDL